MNIGAVFLQLLADGSKLTPQVESEAAKAGDAGAKTLGQKLSGGLKGEAFKVLGAAATAAFGIASKGALELENIQARIRAETGATADEAIAAAKAVNKVAGDERMSLEAVSDIAIKVRRDLGATGDEADKLTAKIARFARVTRQDGGAAVADIDDLMDAWGLTVGDLDGLLDKLVVSGQKFGGTITEDQKALAAMAPQLKAFNLGIDDGIALLDLFKASGLDAAGIPRALNSAIQKLDGRPLQDFIKELASIEDPGLRAQRAIEVFGARAGAQLANAIKPGMDSLEAFKVTTEESIGAVDEAADALDGTITAKIQRFFSQMGAGLRQFGSDFGAAATAVASLGSLIATLGGGKLLRGLANVTLKPLAGLGVKIATFIGAELASSAAGQALSNGLGNQVGSAVGKIPGVGAVKAGATKLGTFLGSTAGKAFSLAFLAAVVLLVVDTYNRIKTEIAEQTQGIADSVGKGLKTATDAQLEIQKAALKTGMDELAKQAYAGNFLAVDPLKDIVAQYNAVQTELNERAARAANEQKYALEGAKQGTAQAAADLADELPTALEKAAARSRAAAEEWARKPVGEQLVLMGHEARQRAAEAALSVAAGFRSARANIGAALDQLREDMKNRLTPKAEVGLRIGQLFSKTLARGLKDADPVIKAQAEGTRALIEDQLIQTIKAGGEAGRKIQEELEKKLKSKDPAVKAQAERTKSVIDAALKATPGKNPGDVIGDQLASDLRSQNTPLGRAAYTLGRTIARNVIRGVQGSGVSVPSTSPTGRHYSGPQEFAEGTGYVPFDQLAVIHRGEIVVPEATASAIRSGDAVLGSAGAPGGNTYQTTLVIPDAKGHDPYAVFDRLGRDVRWGRLAPVSDA